MRKSRSSEILSFIAQPAPLVIAVGLLMFLTPHGSCAGEVSLSGPILDAPVLYPTFLNPDDVVAGDFDNDGFLDIASTGELQIWILTGDSTGLHGQSRLFSTNLRHPLSSQDFDNDNKFDIMSSFTDWIFWSNDEGFFSETEIGDLSFGFDAPAILDINEDDLLDIVLIDRFARMNLFVNSGNRSFSYREVTNFGRLTETELIAADFNNDSIPDLAGRIESIDRFFVMLGNDDLTFQDPQQFVTGNAPKSLDSGDINGDGNIDILVSALDEQNTNLRVLNVYPGNGSGTFPGFIEIPVGTELVRDAIFGDFIGDSSLDIMLVKTDTIQYLEGAGNGFFTLLPEEYYVGEAAGARIYDFNNDSLPDLLTNNVSNGGLSVTFGKEDGAFPSRYINQATEPRELATGDLDGDSVDDIVVCNAVSGSSAINIFLTQEDGTMVDGGTLSRPYSDHTTLALGDVDGNGTTDIITAGRVSSNPTMYGIIVNFNDGDGGFEETLTLESSNLPAIAVGIGFLNIDAFPDLVTTAYDQSGDTDSVKVFLATGAGTFGDPTSFSVGDRPIDLIITDVSGDSVNDIVIANYGSDTISVIIGSASGPTPVTVNYSTDNTPYSLGAGDFNEDGIIDLISSNDGSESLSILPGTGSGFFGQNIDINTQVNTVHLEIADMNGDGHLDVVTGNWTTRLAARSSSIFFGAGDGTFPERQNYAFPDEVWDVAVADFNGDGRLDLAATVGGSSENLTILYGNDLSGTNPTPTPTGTPTNNPTTGWTVR